MNAFPLELPLDRPRLGQPFRKEHRGFSFAPTLAHSLKTLSLQAAVPLEVILLAAFKVLLSYYAGQDTIQVSTPVRHDVRPIRSRRLTSDLGDRLGFLQFSTQLQSAMAAASPPEPPLLSPPSDCPEGTPRPAADAILFPSEQILFEFRTICTPGWSNSPSNPPSNDCDRDVAIDSSANSEDDGFDLSLSIVDSDAQSDAILAYNGALFDAETIDRFVEHYQNLLDNIAANPAQPLATLSPLSKAERHRILGAWNETQADYPLHLGFHRLFEAQVEQTPDSIAVAFETESLAYRDLNRRANRLAHYLRTLGVAADVRVGVCLERSLEMAVALLGILKSGGTYVPLDPNYPQDRLSFVFADAQVAVLMTCSELVSALPEHSGLTICLDSDWPEIGRQRPDNPADLARPDTLAYLMYTSGTTGHPKGVMVEHRNLTNYILATRNEFGFDAADIMPCIAPFSFSISLFELLTPWLAGGTSVILTQQHALDMQRLNASLETLTSLHTVPSLMRQIVAFIRTRETGFERYRNMKRLFIGGDLVPPDLIEAMGQIFENAEIYVLYGCTEVSALCSSHRISGQAASDRNTIGTPLHNASWRLCDRQGRLLPAGMVGEIYVGGAGVSRGYLDRADLTQEKFVVLDGQRLYRTGDLGRFLPDGTMEFLGRSDYQVKIRGIRIEVREIELALLRHPAIEAAVVVAREDETGEKRLIAYLTANLEPVPAAGELRRALKATLPDYMMPAAFMVLDAFPLTPNRKIDRRALPIPPQDRPENTESFVAAQTPAEQTLIRLWEDALGVRPIGSEDHFFNDLGGDSLVAVRLFALIEQVFGRRLPLATLLECPTVAQLAAILAQDRTAAWSALVPIQARGDRPPFFWVHGAGGNVLMYQKLARYLGEDQSVYGLQAQGLDGKDNPLTQVEEMASLYLREVQKIQPQGPYFLGGLSFGGMVSFEMAQLLQAQGQDVALLALIDTPGLDYPKLLPIAPRLWELVPYMGARIAARAVSRLKNRLRNRWNSGTLFRIQRSDSEDPAELAAPSFVQKNEDTSVALHPKARIEEDPTVDDMLSSTGKIRSLGDWLERFSLVMYKYTPWAFLVPKFYLESGRSLPKAFRKVQEANVKAALAYKPKPYAGSLLLFRAEQQPPGCYVDAYLGWRQVVTGHLDVREVPGYHSEALVTEERSVRAIAKHLKLALTKQRQAVSHSEQPLELRT
jgi:amino acid adenylation domain-containing protein